MCIGGTDDVGDGGGAEVTGVSADVDDGEVVVAYRDVVGDGNITYTKDYNNNTNNITNSNNAINNKINSMYANNSNTVNTTRNGKRSINATYMHKPHT